MTFRDTMVACGLAFCGVVLLLFDLFATFAFWQIGTVLVEISPLTLIVYLPLVLALLIAFVVGLVKIANMIEDRIGDGAFDSEPVSYDEHEENEEQYV